MSAFVYEESLDYCSGDQLIWTIRQLVAELRQCHPELEGYNLADLSLCKRPSAVNVTLYFESKH